jgi:hypothetical protein
MVTDQYVAYTLMLLGLEALLALLYMKHVVMQNQPWSAHPVTNLLPFGQLVA